MLKGDHVMPAIKRIKTKYPGVFYIHGTSVSGKSERIYYIRYRKANKMIEEKAGRQFQDDMTPAKASKVRALRIQGRQPSNTEKRAAEVNQQQREANKWTIDRIWNEYRSQKHDSKGIRTDTGRYDLYLKPRFGAKEPHELLLLDLDRLRINLLKKPVKILSHLRDCTCWRSRFCLKNGFALKISSRYRYFFVLSYFFNLLYPFQGGSFYAESLYSLKQEDIWQHDFKL